MHTRKLIVFCLGMFLWLGGCQSADHPTAPTMSDERTLAAMAIRLSDDTQGSAVIPPSYPAGATVIVAIGDSITFGKGGSDGGYPAMLEAKLRLSGYNVVVINEGIPGENSPETAARFLSTVANADIVLLMIGTNDVVNPGACGYFSCDTIGNIDAMLTKAMISNIKAVVSTITPIRSDSYYEPNNGIIRALNAEIVARAAARNAIVADNYSAILAQGGDVLMPDSVHFYDAGYNVIADQWYNAIITNNLLNK